MSGGPSPPGVGPQLRAAWGRVEALLGETHLPETFKWEALRRVRNFYGELQDLAEGVGQAPAEGSGQEAEEGVAVPSLAGEGSEPPGLPLNPGNNSPSGLAVEEIKAKEATKKEKKRKSEASSREERKKKKERREKKKDKERRRKAKEKSLETVTPPASPVRDREPSRTQEEGEKPPAERTSGLEVEETIEKRSGEIREREGEASVPPSPFSPVTRERRSPEQERFSPEDKGRRSDQRSRGRERRRSRDRRSRRRDRARTSPSPRRERGDSRSARARSSGRRPPPEPLYPPAVRAWYPTAPPPGQFGQFGQYYPNWNSKGVKRRLRNWDIRHHGTDPARKAARVEGYRRGEEAAGGR